MDKVFETNPDIKAKIVSPEKIESQHPNIEYVLYKDNRELLGEYYSKALIFVSQSTCDSFGLPPLEAMASGTATVITNTVGSREYAVNRENTIVVPINDPNASAEAIIELLNNHQLRQKFENNGIITAKNYSWPEAISKFNATLLDLIKT